MKHLIKIYDKVSLEIMIFIALLEFGPWKSFQYLN